MNPVVIFRVLEDIELERKGPKFKIEVRLMAGIGNLFGLRLWIGTDG